MIIGWIGVGLLMLSYILLISKWSKWFIPVDTFASFILTIHAWMIWDIPFILVNGFITSILAVKWYKGGI